MKQVISVEYLKNTCPVGIFSLCFNITQSLEEEILRSGRGGGGNCTT